MSIQLLVGKDKVKSGLLVKSNNNFGEIITGGTVSNNTIILNKFNGNTIEIPLEITSSASLSNNPYDFSTWSGDTLSGATRQAIANKINDIDLQIQNTLNTLTNYLPLSGGSGSAMQGSIYLNDFGLEDIRYINSLYSSRIDFEEGVIYDPNDISISWNSRELYTDFGSRVLDWNFQFLYDIDTLYSISWSDRWLYDTNENVSLDWGGRSLLNSSQNISIDWEGGFLYDYDGNVALSWVNERQLYDFFGDLSIDWDQKELVSTLYGPTLNWFSRSLFNDWTIYNDESGDSGLLFYDGANETRVSIGVNSDSITANRRQIFQDKDGVIALLSDITNGSSLSNESYNFSIWSGDTVSGATRQAIANEFENLNNLINDLEISSLSNDPYYFFLWSGDTVSGATRQAIASGIESVRVDTENGLSNSGSTVRLGGTLNQNTIIDGNFDLTFKDNKSFNIENIIASFNNNIGITGLRVFTVLSFNEKILVSGNFTNYNNTNVGSIAILKSNGLIDTSFSGGSNGTIVSNIIMNDNIIVGGNFSQVNSVNVGRIARLNSDGSLDNTFNSGGTGFNGLVWSLKKDSGNKILVGGDFTTYNGSSISAGLVRLNSDGSLDTTFNSGGVGTFNVRSVYSIEILSDNRILVGGGFSQYNSVNVGRIARLNSDGSLDNTFNSGGTGFNGSVWSLKKDSGNKILVGGEFTTYNGSSVSTRLVRLNSDGTLDSTFNSGGTGFNGIVNEIIIQTNGQIMVVGGFTQYNGSSVSTGLVRLNSDGTLDSTFNSGGTGFNNTDVRGILGLSNGDFIVGGGFTQYNNNLTPKGVALIKNDGSLDADINVKVFIDKEKGLLRYGDNYHVNYTNRTLVDKEFLELYTSNILNNYVTTNSVQNIIAQKTFLSASTRFQSIEINDSISYKKALSSSIINELNIGNGFQSYLFGDEVTRNTIRISSGGIGQSVNIQAVGLDANINNDYTTKGTGIHRFAGTIAYFDPIASTFRNVIANHPVNENVLDLARGYTSVFLRGVTNGVNVNSVQATNKGILNIPVTTRPSIYISDNFSKGAGTAALSIDTSDSVGSIRAVRSGTNTATWTIEATSTRSFRAVILGNVTYPNNFEIQGYTTNFPASSGAVYNNTNISWFKAEYVYGVSSSGNINNIRDFYSVHNNINTGNGYSIANRTGFEVSFNNSAGQNQYGFRSSVNVDPDDPTRLRYNIFSTGNAPSHINGWLGMGTSNTVPTALLDLTGSTIDRASLRVRTGVEPSVLLDGLVWKTNDAFKFRINTDTINLYPETTSISGSTWDHNGMSGAVHVNDTFGGYTIGQVVTALKNFGLLK